MIAAKSDTPVWSAFVCLVALLVLTSSGCNRKPSNNGDSFTADVVLDASAVSIGRLHGKLYLRQDHLCLDWGNFVEVFDLRKRTGWRAFPGSKVYQDLGDKELSTYAPLFTNGSMRGKRLPEAETQLRKVVTAHPDQAAVHVQLGRVLAAQGKNDDAIAELESAAKLAPSDLSVQRDLADLYDLAGKPDKAEAAYRTLIAAHPQDAELRHGLGKSLMRQKKFAEAQKELLEALRLKPDLGAAYGDLAFVAGENKDYALTLKALDARVKFLPEIPITYFLRASAFDHLHDVKRATANYHLFLQSANGKYPDQEWQAKHRLIALEPRK